VRRQYDPVYQAIFASGRLRPEMRFTEKIAVLAEFEKEVPGLERPPMDEEAVRKEFGVHPKLNCPDLSAADEMYRKIIEITEGGDSSGGVAEVIATGVPAGLGEPIFKKLDAELGKMMGIGTVKAVEIGGGMAAKDAVGSQFNDQMRVENGHVKFLSNNAGGITGGLTTGQDIVARIAVKPTPTIAKDQLTIDKVSLENQKLSAVTRRDPTIVPRVWPVAEAFMALILVDHLMMHLAYQAMAKAVQR
jgi:chorismate synthase